jgi:hypothetical protein
MRTIATLGLLSACALGCGVPEPPPDRSSPQAVFEDALAAARRADWRALSALLTEEAREQLRNELSWFQGRLRDPEKGAFYRNLAGERIATGADEAFTRARDGTREDVLAFVMALSPRGPKPAIRGTRFDKEAWEFLYETDLGETKVVRLVRGRRDGRWLVSELQL